MKLKIKQATLRTLYSYVGILSLVVNTSSPFLVSLQYTAYAQEVGASVEESGPTDAPSEEPSDATGEEPSEETAPAEESASPEESAPAEESVTVETVAETPVTEEVLGTSTEDQTTTETPPETLPETPTDETQQGDILPDGVSDYRPEVVEEPDVAYSAAITEIITDTTDVIDPVIEQIEGTVTEAEKECLADGVEITDSPKEDWTVDSEKGYAETKEPVKLGVKYIFPEEEGVSVTFSCLPKNIDDRSVLRIQEVKVSDLNLPEEFNTDAEFAYDITTDMVNGEFEYDLTLPKPEGVEADIFYIEKSVEEAIQEVDNDDVKKVEKDKLEQGDDVVEVSGIDHFTIYYLAPPNETWACQNDEQGLNDEPGQKDLTKMCLDTASTNPLSISWDWDDTAWSGSNTGDACSLFDTDTDGFANFALCVTVHNDPAEYQSKGLYSCNDTKSDRCAGAIAISPISSTCTAGIQSSDPFVGGEAYPNDTVASCVVQLSEVGGSSSKLLDVCSFPSQEPGSDPSDCIVASTASQTGLLEVRKVLVPSTDSGLFNLQIDGTTYATNVGDLGTTGEKIVNAGDHTVGEIAGTGANLANYTSEIVCKNNNGTGSIIASSSTSGPLTVSVSNNADIVCTITNSQKIGTLIVKKVVVNNNGGLLEADDFTFMVGDGAPVSFEADGQNDLTVNAGTYTITEPAVFGYATTYDNCTSVNISAGQTKTCTITNDDLPGTLIVIKTMNNGDGGGKSASDFSFSVNGGTAIPFEFDGQNNLPVDAGTYNIVEPSVYGYTPSYNNCSNLVIPNGGSETCTITNDDQPAVIVVNKVIVDEEFGDKGVADFSFKLDLPDAENHQFEPYGSNEVEVAPGTYTVLENEDSRYNTEYDNCENITVTNGDRKSCTITNTPNQGSVSGYKWDDTNGDGARDPSEPFISNWTINLIDSTGIIDTKTTDSVGKYEFEGYYIGEFQICESTADTSWVATYPNGACHDVSLDLGRKVEDKNFGNFKLGKITACKYEDLNGNGEKEEGDFALDGISMILSKQVDSVWVPQEPQETEDDGCTVFTGLTVGQYRVEEDYTDPDLIGYYSSNSITQQDFSITSGFDVTADFLNAQYRTISGQKYDDVNGNGQKDLDEPGLPDWTIFIETNGNGILDAEETFITTDAEGNYQFTNLVSDEYRIREVQKSGWTRTDPVADYLDVDLHNLYSSSGNDFGNFKLASITACKYADSEVRQEVEENGIQSSLYTQGWGVTLTTDRELEDPQTTGQNGCYTWEGLGPNTNFLVTEESRDFWTPNGSTSCEFNNLTSGSNNTCDFHNVQQMPELFITKKNGSGASESPGNTVRFTITVRAENSPVKDVIVRDLLSDGFDFNHFDTDTWDATSSIRGNIEDGVTVTGYLSPGKWEIGDMTVGETITLVYDVVIGSEVTTGIYKDLAWARGKDIWDTSESEGSVFATAEDPGDLADTADRFVGTQVKVTFTPESSAKAEVDEEEITEEVLGTSTVRLPATGASTVVLISAITIMLLGISLVALSRRKKVLMALPIFLFVVFAGSGMAYAETQDPYLIVRLEDPAGNYNEPFQLTFVAMDTLGGRALTAKCYMDGPDSAAHDFSTISINPGGDTKICDVTDGVLGDNGTYKFWVTLSAEGGDGPVKSEEVETDYDNDGPDKPKYIEVDRKSDCKYEITLKTANDGQTSYVEVYMSDEKEFTAGPGSRIRTFTMGPDEKKTFTEEVGGEKCAHRQYFAVRAFDSSDNGSDVEAEELVDVNTVTINKEEIIYEASLASSGASSVGPGAGNENAEVVPTEEEIGGPGEEGSVLGEQVQDENTTEKSFLGKLISSPWTWVVLVVILGGLTINGLRKRNA